MRVILSIFAVSLVSPVASASLRECAAWLSARYQGGATGALYELSIKTEDLIRTRHRNGAAGISIQEAVEFQVAQISATLTDPQKVQFWESLVGGASLEVRTGIAFDFDYGVGQVRELVPWHKLRDAIAEQLLEPLAELGSGNAWRAVAMAMTLPAESFPRSRQKSLAMVKGSTTRNEKIGLKMALALIRERNSLLAAELRALSLRIETARFPDLLLFSNRNTLNLQLEDQQEVATILAAELASSEASGG